MKLNVTEESIGAKNHFERLFPQATLFKLPKEASSVGAIARSTGQDIDNSIKEWHEDAIMPFPLTATEFFYDPHNYTREQLHLREDEDVTDFVFTEQAIFWLMPNMNLKFLVRLEVKDFEVDVHTIRYALFELDGDGWIIHNPYQPIEAKTSNRVDPNRTYGDNYAFECMMACSRFVYLIEALQSVEHTTTRGEVSRQVARSTHVPRYHHVIHIRPKHDRKTTSAKVQYAEVIRAAHAVREHKREEHLRQYPSGKIAVVRPHKVSAHIRGRGGAVQLRDYIVHGVGK